MSDRHVLDVLQEALDAAKLQTIILRPETAFGFKKGPITYYVTKLPGGKIRLCQSADGKGWGPIMPEASLKHFVNDIEGRVELPRSRVPEIDAVIRGIAEPLGKGDDGMVFRVSSSVVKVSTTVPFQPENQGHLSPAQAIERLRKQTEMHNIAAKLGFAEPARFYKHGDKGFQIQPVLRLVKKFTRAQLDEIQRGVVAFHDRGLVIGDTLQFGLDRKGHAKAYDLGKTDRASDSFPRYSWRSQYENDMERVEELYRDSGVSFVDADPRRDELVSKTTREARAQRLTREAARLIKR